MTGEKRTGGRRFLPLALILAGLLAAYALGLHRHLSLAELAHQRSEIKQAAAANLPLAALAFTVLYALATILLLPGAAILTLAGGFLFGWWIGGSLATLGATLGSAVVFLAARGAVGGLLRRRAGGRLQRFAEGFREDAFTYLLILRLAPIVPFSVLNLAPAFFDISLRSFVAATFIGVAPGAMVYAFLGSGLGKALKAAGNRDVTVSDLVTTEMSVALAGLCALSLVGLVLKKRLARRSGGKPAAAEAQPDA